MAECDMFTMRAQRTPAGQLLGACTVIPADLLRPFVDGSEVEYLRCQLQPVSGGILLKIEGEANSEVSGGGVVDE